MLHYTFIVLSLAISLVEGNGADIASATVFIFIDRTEAVEPQRSTVTDLSAVTGGNELKSEEGSGEVEMQEDVTQVIIISHRSTVTDLSAVTGGKELKSEEGSGEVEMQEDVTQVIIIIHVPDKALSAITVTGCTISMVGLLATAVTYLYFWRFVKSVRGTLLINLCAILFVVYLIFLIGIQSTENMTSCTAVAVLLHYVYLVAFFVMLADVGVIALMVLRPFGMNNVVLVFLTAAYGIPLIIVAISMGATRLIGYGNERFCWLSMESGLFWAFAGPVLTIVATNTILMVLVLKRLFGVNALETTDVEKIKTGVRSVCILLPVLGLTLVFGIFAVNKDTLVFQYLFAICNSLQGILIFLVQCVFDRKVRDAVRQARIPWLTAATERRTGEEEMQSMEKSDTHGASAATSNIYN